jgi:hypothetical protein
VFGDIRIVDIRVAKLAVAIVRYLFPPAMALALIQRRRNQRVVEREATKIAIARAEVRPIRRCAYAHANVI